MEGGIPVIDGRMVTAEGEFEIVVEIVTQDQTFDLQVETGGGRRPGSGIAASREGHLSEEGDLGRERRGQVQSGLSQLEATVRTEQRLGAKPDRKSVV